MTPTPRAVSRRNALALALAGAGTVGLAACGAGEGSSAPSTAGASSGEGFPVTLKHAFGETTVERTPQKIATVGWMSQDVALALGVVPAGMPKFTYGGNAEGILPWNEAEFEGKPRPTLYDETDGPNVEALAALAPDLILAIYSGITEEDYAKLSKIAPVVAYPDKPYATPMDRQTLMIGEALGKKDEAQKLLDSYNATLAEAASAKPELKDKSFAYLNFTADTSKINVYNATDARVDLVEKLGMKLAPSVAELTQGSDSFYTEISAEKADQITADVVYAWVDSPETASKVLADPLLGKIPAISKGAVALFSDQGLTFATSSVSVLSVPWALKNTTWLDQLAQAAGKA